MQINWRKIQLTLFIWYAWSLMHLKSAWESIVFWMGLYLPLFVVDFIVHQYSLDRLDVENNNNEKIKLQFFRIEYQVLYRISHYPTKLRYDITSRALWFLHFVGNNYTDFINYTARAIPWDDLHCKKFNNDAEIVFKYIISPYEECQPVKLTLTHNNQYFWEHYGAEPVNPPTSYDVMFDMLNFLEPEVSDSDDE